MNADGKLSPALAESYDTSSDGKVYTFHLRKGVKFHDGSAMTAADVVFTLDLNFKNSSGKALLVNYDHSEAVDENTVKVYLTNPYSAFDKAVASRAAYVISKAYYDKVGNAGYLKAPIGTGAYKFVKAVSGDAVTLQAFDGYWGGTVPIKNVNIKTMTDPSSQTIALENGNIDMIISPAISSVVNLDKKKGVTWEKGDSAGRVTLYISSNSGQPGQDINFRKAVQSAINKKDVIQGATNGNATQIDIDMCPNYSGYPSGFKVVSNNDTQAKTYLSQSNYQKQPFELLVQAGTSSEAVAQIVQAQLMNVGINCTINSVDTSTFTSLWYAGKFGGMIRTTTSTLVDGDGFLNYFMATDYAPTNNNQYPMTKQIYDMGIQARAASGQDRSDLYKKMVDIVTDQAYEVPLFANPNTLAYNTSLKGVKVHPLTYVFFNDLSWN